MDSINVTSLGDAIYQARHRFRWTQRDLAGASGIPVGTVRRDERGGTIPAARLHRYGQALQCSFILGQAPAEGIEPSTYRCATGDAA